MSVDHTNLHVVIAVTEAQRYGVQLSRTEVTAAAPSLADDAQGIEDLLEGVVTRVVRRVIEDLRAEAQQRAAMEQGRAA